MAGAKHTCVFRKRFDDASDRLVFIILEVDDDRYADLANAVWLLAYNTGLEFTVTPDREAEASRLNEAWSRYGDVSW